MKTSIIVIISVFNFSIVEKGYCQNIFNNIELSVGYGIQPQDRRLFEFPHQEELIALEKSRYDYQYDILLSKNILDTKFLTFSSGLGYSLFLSKFSRPFDNCYYIPKGETCPYVLLVVKRYSIHSFKISNSIKFNIINHEKNIICIVFPMDINIAFNKNVKRRSGLERQE